ncbi:MAG TPA: DUF2169 domain-containing protein [Gemmatimonadaceae bacterium]|nr:DUF2169 domain-containing protein [Gemmatimonadaceae bacterium]
MGSNGVYQIVPGQNDAGEHVFSVIAKRTYRFLPNGGTERHTTDHPLRLIDVYYDDGDPETSTVQHESELAPYKDATDVVVIGKAYAPAGFPTRRMMIGVQVGTVQKFLVVTGDRHCHFREGALPAFSEAAPFIEMEIRYERAYGGRDEKSIPDIPFIYPRNAMGTGVVLRNIREAVDGLPLPNIEDAQDLLTPERMFIEEPERWHLQPLPQGFGWRQRSWYPRSALIGSYPPFLDPGTVTAEERLGLLPNDHVALAKQSRLKPMVAQFNNGASLGMTFPDLKGDEQIMLGGLSPDGLLRFTLPADPPTITIDIGLGEQQPPPKLHTVSIRPDDREFDLVWRAATPYEGYSWLPKMKRLHVEVQ